MAPGMMRQISANIQNATFFMIMADETADVSNKEQLVVCIRWVDVCFVIHKDFIGMHPLKRTSADQVVAILTNVLRQCYDGAATKAGEKTGIATQIKCVNVGHSLSPPSHFMFATGLNCTRKIMCILINNILEKISRCLSRRNARLSRNQGKIAPSIAPSRAYAWFESKRFDWPSVSFFYHRPIRMLGLLPLFALN